MTSRMMSLITMIVIGASAHARGAEPSTAPAPATGPTTTRWFGRPPEYPIPYAPPTAAEVKTVLDRIRDRIDAGMGYRMIDRRTREVITDLSKPNPDATLEQGPGSERIFMPYTYPSGVIYSGMLLAHEVTGDARYAEFVTKRYQTFADALPHFAKWPAEAQRRNPLRNMLDPRNLDACGAMGVSFAKAQRMKLGPDLSEVINRFADYISNKQMRLEDGLLARPDPFPKSLWLDDAYMSVPLLAQYALITGERKYFDDAAKQMKLFHKHLFRPEKGLFTHGANMDNPDNHPDYFWGRANGWYFVALAELLDVLPADHADRDALVKIHRAHAKGLATVQSGSGLWHQMLDRPDSYLETSCTAMFAYGMARGVNKGWLSASQYGPVAISGWNAVTTRVSEKGHITGICIGTAYADDYVYYYHRPSRDDSHGYGPVLLCGAEMIRLVNNPKIAIKAEVGQPTMINDKP